MKTLIPRFWIIILFLCCASSLNAATFKIANGDITALRSAINTSNINNQRDTIFLAYKGTYTFTVATMTNTPFMAAFVIADDSLNPANAVVIYGNGSIIERDINAADSFRIISNIGHTELNDLYIRNGKVSLNADGAGIYNAGSITMNRCTFTDNSGAFFGGALYGGYGGYCKLVNCTITACSAAFGSALYFPFADADVINCTITKNVCWGNTGRVAVLTGTIALDPNSHIVITNTIIADNKDGDGTYNDAGGALRSGSGNLIGSIKDVNTAYFIFNDQTGTPANPIDPKLGVFAYYGGGLVPTIPLASTASPAFGKATSNFAPSLDQIGTNRVGAPSIGSMELTPSNFAFLKPKMQVLNNNNLIADGSGQVNFPSIVNGQQSLIENVIIKNNFNSICLLRLQANPQIIITGTNAEDFKVYADTIRTEFAPLSGHAETAFQIRFTPKSTGQKTAIITVPSNDIDHPVYQFTITGEAINPLPVELYAFSGSATVIGNLLKWQTQSEHNNKQFEIWRSNGEQKPALLAIINGAGNATVLKSYQFIDRKIPNGTNYYELKQVDFNGAEKSYGPIALRNSLSKTSVQIFANEKGVEINLSANQAGQLLFSIYDVNGKKIVALNKYLDEGQNQFLLEKDLTNGTYMLTITGTGINQRLKFIRQ